MFKVGDKVRFKPSEESYNKYSKCIFTVVGTSIAKDGETLLKCRDKINAVYNEWYSYRFELVKPKRSHLPRWF